MKEPHSESLANYADLESCAGGGVIAGEAVDRGTDGPPIEPRNTSFRVPTLWTKGKDISTAALSQAAAEPGAVGDPGDALPPGGRPVGEGARPTRTSPRSRTGP